MHTWSRADLSAGWVVIAIIITITTSTGMCQGQSARPQAPTTSLRLGGIAIAPLTPPLPGRLVTFRIPVLNSGDTQQSALVMGALAQAPSLQGAVQVTVPPGESRSAELRLWVPGSLAPGSALDLNVSLNATEPGERVLLSSSGHPIIDSLSLRVDSEKFVTATMLDAGAQQLPEWAWPRDDDLMSYELTLAARVHAQLSRRTVSVAHESLPAQLADSRGIDALILARDEALRDPPAVASLGAWLAGGGRLWIMLDKISPQNLRPLLPAGMSCEMIDDVELNEFVVSSHQLAPISAEDCSVRVEKPVQLRRVVQRGGAISHEIDGFPAAIWFYVGRGRLLVTTLEASAWVERRPAPSDADSLYDSDYQMRLWAQSLADQFHEYPDTRAPLEQAELNYPLKHLGNPVPDRSYVIGIVFAFCVLLAIAGGLCWHAGKTLWLGWLVPLISIAACLPILIAAGRLRRGMSDTSAHLQVIEVQPGSRVIHGWQWTGHYTSQSHSAVLRANGDAVIQWPRSNQPLDLRRWLWKDFQEWELSSSSWPTGIWRSDSRFTLPPQRLDVVARLDRDGIALELPDELEQPLEDAVLVYRAGDRAICGTVKAGQPARVSDRHLTAADSCLGDALVDDEQARRDEVYRQVTARAGQQRYPNFPALLGWTKLWPTPVAWSEPRDERGSALVLLPVNLLPVAPGEEVIVPHSVVAVETPSIGQTRSSAFWNPSGHWRDETTVAMSVPIRFHLPEQVCPIEAHEIICDIQLRAPQREVTIASSASGAAGMIASLQSPLVAQQFRISDPAVLADARDGTLDFTLTISDVIGRDPRDTRAQVGAWQVDYFRISLRGRVEPR